jgi:anti-sigma regulatory factor (Ser/Thr protein kinase)
VSAQREFTGVAASAVEVRRFVRDALVGVPARVVDDVAAMASELAANAVRHAASDFVVVVGQSRGRVRVEVGDHGPGEPVLRYPSPSDPSGRGLLIVRELSTEWGVSARDGGKAVWFVVETPSKVSPCRRSAMTNSCSISS